MSTFLRQAKRTPDEVLGSVHYLIHELDHDRLWQAQQAIDLLSLLDTSQPGPITLDHIAAVAAYASEAMREALGNVVTPANKPLAPDDI